MEIIFSLIGAKGAGKTTAFNAITEVLSVTEITFAKKLKDVSSKVLNIPRNYFDDQDLKEKELETPVYLNWDILDSIFFCFGVEVDYNKYIRPHIGKVLYTPRQIAQYIGTEVLRKFDINIHCIGALEDAKTLNNKVGVVTDMRFPNEFEYFKNQNIKFVPIYIKNRTAEVIAAKDPHPSEAHIQELGAKASYVVDNGFISKSDFIKEIKALINSFNLGEK